MCKVSKQSVSHKRIRPTYRPRIVAETDEYLVVDKPPFLPAHPSKPGGGVTLWDELRGLLAYELANGGQVSLINRLDRETSGLTLVAKTLAAARHFSKRMMERRSHKEYLALVTGWPTEDAWRVDGPLLRQGDIAPSRIYLKQCVHPAGTPAVTTFRVERRVEKNGGRFAIVRAFPETGRMHQIRVHLSHSGHPIVGDKLYGPSEDCYLEFIETGWTPTLAARLTLNRQALHACLLRVDDLEWHSGMPDDFHL